MQEIYMQMAYQEAMKAFKKDEIPVGTVIVYKGKVLARAHNSRMKNNSVLGHAEITAILKAEKKLKDWRLDQCDLYVTLKPCGMCEKVIQEARIQNVYFLTEKPSNKKEYAQTKFEICNFNDSDLQNLYLQKLSDFFKKRR